MAAVCFGSKQSQARWLAHAPVSGEAGGFSWKLESAPFRPVDEAVLDDLAREDVGVRPVR